MISLEFSQIVVSGLSYYGGIIMKRIFRILFTIGLLISVSLVGCSKAGKADMEGIALDVHEHGIELARELSPSEYEEIKDESVSKIHSEEVRGERASLGLIDLTYDNTDEISKGDEVEVWLAGDIFDSYPPQADARKIIVKE